MSLGNAVYQVVSVGATSAAPRYPTPLPALWCLVEFYLRGPDGSIRAARPTCCTLLRRDPCFDASVRIGRVWTPVCFLLLSFSQFIVTIIWYTANDFRDQVINTDGHLFWINLLFGHWLSWFLLPPSQTHCKSSQPEA